MAPVRYGEAASWPSDAEDAGQVNGRTDWHSKQTQIFSTIGAGVRPRYSCPPTIRYVFATHGQLSDRMPTAILARVGRSVAVPQTPLILCVDDDASIRDAMAGLLKAFGFDTEVFPSAEDVLKSGRLDHTSCLITDIKLPGISGLQLQDHLVASGHRIPTIVITAFPEERVRARALRAGAVCFLSKPVTKEELLICIRSALTSRTHRLLSDPH
jgi:CheY-like chemotaxis protein